MCAKCAVPLCRKPRGGDFGLQSCWDLWHSETTLPLHPSGNPLVLTLPPSHRHLTGKSRIFFAQRVPRQPIKFPATIVLPDSVQSRPATPCALAIARRLRRRLLRRHVRHARPWPGRHVLASAAAAAAAVAAAAGLRKQLVSMFVHFSVSS